MDKKIFKNGQNSRQHLPRTIIKKQKILALAGTESKPVLHI